MKMRGARGNGGRHPRVQMCPLRPPDMTGRRLDMTGRRPDTTGRRPDVARIVRGWADRVGANGRCAPHVSSLILVLECVGTGRTHDGTIRTQRVTYAPHTRPRIPRRAPHGEHSRAHRCRALPAPATKLKPSRKSRWVLAPPSPLLISVLSTGPLCSLPCAHGWGRWGTLNSRQREAGRTSLISHPSHLSNPR